MSGARIQFIRVVPTPQLTVSCPSTGVHPSLVGCVPLNTFDLVVVYDSGGIPLVPTYKYIR